MPQVLLAASETATHEMLLTMAAALAAGVGLIALAHRLHVSAISLLLIGGVALGPEGLGIVQPDSLGHSFGVVVALAVALILFEGGLSLDLHGFRTAGGVIQRLLSVGVLVTWLTTAGIVYLLFNVLGDRGLSIAFCLLCGSLVIVTGPTVIAPMLKRIRVQPRVHGILHWEGVLIDPVGVFVAVLCFEWLTTSSGGDAVASFFIRFGAGGAIGLVGGWLLSLLLRSRLVPNEMVNITAIASAMVVFGLAEAVRSEAGLLSVTVAGFVLGVRGRERLRGLREFKAEITELMIGLLFVLLAARLELRQFLEFGWMGALLVLGVVVVVRPLSILISSAGQGLRWQEKLFLSWVAPRGIVAASLAFLVGLTLTQQGDTEGGEFIVSFVYSVIATTVLLQGGTAGLLARALGLRRPEAHGFMIVGAHALARRIARYLKNRAEVPVLLIDSNARFVAMARDRGLPALAVNAMDVDEIEELDEFLGIGNVLALTDNEELNVLICQRWQDTVGKDHVFRWTSRANVARQGRSAPGSPVWPDLPNPTLLALELQRGNAHTFDGAGEGPGEGMVTPLLAVKDGVVVASPDEATIAAADTVLRLRRRGHYLWRSVQRELVLRCEARTGDALLAEMVERASAVIPDLPSQALLETLRDQEMVMASLLGGGVAAPHTSLDDLETRICVVGLVPAGVDLAADDGEPVRLVFLLLSPSTDVAGHLATLAELASLVADERVRTRLTSSATAEELVTRLREAIAP